MKPIKESDLKVLFNENEIQDSISKLADTLNKTYKNEEIYLICVLKGSVLFMTDLMEFLVYSRFLNGGKTSSEIPSWLFSQGKTVRWNSFSNVF